MTKHLLFLDPLIDKRIKSYCSFCSLQLFFWILFFILLIGLGSSFFPFSTEVPIYLPHSTQYKRIAAVLSGEDIANYGTYSAGIQLSQSLFIDEEGEQESKIEIIYVARDKNIFTYQHLEDIWKIEQDILSKPNFIDYCLIEWTDADLELFRVVRNSHNYTLIEELNQKKSERGCSPPLSALWSCDPTLGVNCTEVVSSPPGLLDCQQTTEPCQPEQMILDEDFFQTKVEKYAETLPFTNQMVKDFYNYPENNFGNGSSISKTLKSEFRFAFPLSGYENYETSKTEQQDKLAEWLYKSYLNFLFDVSPKDMDVWFNGWHLEEWYLQDKLITDTLLLLFSIFFVYIYISFLEKSHFIASHSLYQIFFAFIPSYFIYFLVFQQKYFGIFNILAIFIILGIGADDMFVYLDTWRQSGVYDHLFQSEKIRLSWTWKRSSKAMLVTSLTTMASFAATATSSFPSNSTFGLFASCLVFVNYCAVISYFPSVVSVYEQYVKNRFRYCFGIGDYLDSIFVKKDIKEKELEEISPSDKSSPEPIPPPPPPPPLPSLRFIEIWFRDIYFPKIYKFRYLILVFYVIVIICTGIGVSKLETSESQPQLWPDDNNFERYPLVKSDYYSSGDPFLINLRLVWGFDSDHPLDQSGVNFADREDYGKPVWDTNYDPSIGAECMIHLCNEAEKRSSERKTSGPIEHKISCWVRNFKVWVINSTSESLWNNITGINSDSERFYELLDIWMSDVKVYDTWKSYIYSEKLSDGSIINRFSFASLTLDESFKISYQDGLDLYDTWENWFTEQYSKEPCSGVSSSVPGFQYTPDPGWHYFLVRRELEREAYVGLAVSLLLSGIVCSLATMNVIIGLTVVIMITSVVMAVITFSVAFGWKMGLIEAVIFVMVPGLAVDFIAHIGASYTEAVDQPNRENKVREAITNVGISIVSGAFSTLGSTFILLFAYIIFFFEFGALIFITILTSVFYSLFFYTTLMTVVGPEGNAGSLLPIITKIKSFFIPHQN